MSPRVGWMICLGLLGLLPGCSWPGQTDAGVAADQEQKRPPHPERVTNAPTPRISPMTHLTAGQMLERQGDLPGAVEQYERAISANPRFTSAYNRLAIVHQKLGHFEDAEQVLKSGIQADPGAAMLQNNLGYCYLAQNRLSDAEYRFREALTISPEFKRARMNLAIVLARAGRLEESLTEFSRAAPADIAHYNLGVVCLDLRDYANAEKAFRAALLANPDCPGAKAHLDRTIRLARNKPDQKMPSEGPPPSIAGQIREGEGTVGDAAGTVNP